MLLWRTNPFQPITLVRAEGCTVWDIAGKSYLDLLSGTWCGVLGSGHPRLLCAIHDQASRIVHTGSSFITLEITRALSKLQEIIPPQLNRAVFLNSGSEAVELALKMARAATGADVVVVMERGYYGATTYALGLSEVGRAAHYLPPLGSVLRLPAPYCLHCPLGCSQPCHEEFPCLNPLAELADNGKKKIAAVLFEPVMGGGIIVPPLGYGARLRALTARCQAVFIAEEVTTGMGRTGRWFGFEHEGILPDILVIGKAIGAGLPVSAVVTTEDIEKRCQGIISRHVQSHQNDPFSGRIAATVISILQEERLVERAAEIGEYFLAGLRNTGLGSGMISEVRGWGAMLGVELHPDFSGKGMEISQRLLGAGFIVDYHQPTATFRLFPPYVISHLEIDAFIIAFRKTLLEIRSDS